MKMTGNCKHCGRFITDKEPYYKMEVLHFDSNAIFETDQEGKTIRIEGKTQVKPVGSTGNLLYCESCFQEHKVDVWREIEYWESEIV